MNRLPASIQTMCVDRLVIDIVALGLEFKFRSDWNWTVGLAGFGHRQTKSFQKMILCILFVYTRCGQVFVVFYDYDYDEKKKNLDLKQIEAVDGVLFERQRVDVEFDVMVDGVVLCSAIVRDGRHTHGTHNIVFVAQLIV